MSRKTAILVDSGCDLPEQLIEKYHLYVLRLKIAYGTETCLDGETITAGEVYDRFSKEIPKTSAPNLFDVEELVDRIVDDGYENVIAVCISSALSSTFNSIRLALGENTAVNSFVFDTKNISIGAGMYALWAAQKLEQGATYEEVIGALPKKLNDSKVFFYMDTLKYLIAGGRIGKIAGAIGSALDIKPVITCDKKGEYTKAALAKGRGKALEKLLAIVCKNKKAADWVAIMQGNAGATIAEIKPKVQRMLKGAQIVVEKQITASLAVHTGPGLVGICTFKA